MFWTVYKGASELDKDWVETDQSKIIAVELLVGWRFLLNSLRYIYEPIICLTSVFYYKWNWNKYSTVSSTLLSVQVE